MVLVILAITITITIIIIILIKVSVVVDLVMDLMFNHQVEQIIIICRTVVDLVDLITLTQCKKLKKILNQRKKINNLLTNLTMKNSHINLLQIIIFTMNQQKKRNTALILLDLHHKLTNNLNNSNSSNLRELQLIQRKNLFHFKRILSFMEIITKIHITTTVTARGVLVHL